MEHQSEEILELFERDGRTLYTLIYRITLREDVAEELMQELFIKLSKLSRVEKIVNLGAYAKRSAVNIGMDYRRKQIHSPSIVELEEEQVGYHNSPSKQLIDVENFQGILDKISQLRGLSREAFVLKYIEDKTYEEIAADMGKTPHQVRALCFKALGHIRYLLEEEDGDLSGRQY